MREQATAELLMEASTGQNSPSVLEQVRRCCREVAGKASLVRIEEERLPEYAASLPRELLALPQMDPAIHYLGHGRDTVAYFLTLAAVNFGSGYFADIFGDTRRSGYRTFAAALTAYFASHGPLPAAELRRINTGDCARIFGLDPSHPPAGELMGLFTRGLNDLGALLCDRFHGECTSLVAEAEGSAERLVAALSEMPLFKDVASYRGMSVPFYKRAQLAAIDLFIAFHGEEPGRFDDIDRVTICADNLVPHVLRLDGILVYEQGLASRIDWGEPLAASSPEEVEIRACAVHAGELLVAELHRQGVKVNALMLDNLLWHRGQEPSYRARPRHRTRTVFY